MRLTNRSGDATMRYRTFSKKVVSASSFVTTERESEAILGARHCEIERITAD